MYPDNMKAEPGIGEMEKCGAPTIVCKVEYVEDLNEDLDGSFCCGTGDNRFAQEDVEHFHLQSGPTAVSIMQLQMCIDEEVVSEGDGTEDIYLVGRSAIRSKDIRVAAERWKLNLLSSCAPTFLIKTAGSWIQVQKPKPAYRLVMKDGLTLAHFLYFVVRHPDSSAEATKEHLANEFRQFGEQPAIGMLSACIHIIRKYVAAHVELEKATVLGEFFPHHFGNLLASGPGMKMHDIWQNEKLHPLAIANSFAFDLNKEIDNDIMESAQQKATPTSKGKASKPRRVSVQTDLRNLNSQWRSLMSGGAKGKVVEKRPAPRKNRGLSRHQCSVATEKSIPNVSDLSGKAPPVPKLPLQTPLESKTSVVKRLKKSGPKAEATNFPLTEAVPKLKEKTTDLKHKRVIRQPTPAVAVAERRASYYDKEGLNLPRKQGVHSPSKEIFEILQDPPICIICDDGGDLICCEGPCRRYFHAMPGPNILCKTLGLTLQQTKAPEYYCQNCLSRRHQCFICDELGSSVPTPYEPQEVFMCDAHGCRRFYHADCVALFPNPGRDSIAVAERIKRGLHGFLCPRHFCATCRKAEMPRGTFVQCRRCPKAWHRECLTNFSSSDELPTTSIWRQNDREFIYCKKHKILDYQQTPVQDHVSFPNS